MTLVKWTPRRPALNIFDDIERMVSQAFGSRITTRDSWTPAFNLVESEREFYIEAELPGVEKKHVEVNISEGVLTVSGERKGSAHADEDNIHFYESWNGGFHRSFTLPENTDGDKVKAKFKNGVLTLTIPKIEPVHPEVKKITIS